MNEVVNGVAGSGAEVAVLPNGTGQDFGRTHGIPSRFDDAVRIAVSGVPRPVDVGHVTFRGPDGAEATRFFANVGSVGMSGAVARRANSSSKALGGRATFYYALVREFLAWQNTEVTVRFDGGERRGRMHDVIVANGQWHAGGMKLAPDAAPRRRRLRRGADRRRLEARLRHDVTEALRRRPRRPSQGGGGAEPVGRRRRRGGAADRARRRGVRNHAGPVRGAAGRAALRAFRVSPRPSASRRWTCSPSSSWPGSSESSPVAVSDDPSRAARRSSIASSRFSILSRPGECLAGPVLSSVARCMALRAVVRLRDPAERVLAGRLDLGDHRLLLRHDGRILHAVC